ncbi:Uncharacterized protein SCF082_LOCUS14012 [Durusdinium trenchii]|uniref:Uncharacterized protein n=1 Tax=Durusdinium trenchii TaxID=1381693 RepID=A0ABP0JV59_9DINO
MEAYQDAAVVLEEVAGALGKTRSTLRIYDPFFCDGGVVHALGRLGFDHVYNKCEDFYAMVARDALPEFDVLLTNPPFSGDHMERLVGFATTHPKALGKPFMLLMPNFVYTKPFFAAASQKISFLVRPMQRYAFVPPRWVSTSKGSTSLAKGKKTTSPYPTFWYCGNIAPPSSIHFVDKVHRGMFEHALLWCKDQKCLPNELRGEFDVKRKRPNPKARKRLRNQKRLRRV